MKFPKINISPKAYIIGTVLFIIVLSASLMGNSHYRTVKRVRVEISNEYENYFIDEKEILRLVTHNDDDPIVGKYLREVDLKVLEKRVRQCPFVEEVQAFKSHSGVVKIEVHQVKPLARIYHNGVNDKYLLPNGKLIAVSPKYTSRSLIVRGDYMYKFGDTAFVNTADWKAYVDFFHRISTDKHWNAQVAELKIQRDGSIIIFPQIGDYEIKFGKPDDLDIKFKKLNIFFREILPLRGWDAYQAVNVQYKDQIVCD